MSALSSMNSTNASGNSPAIQSVVNHSPVFAHRKTSQHHGWRNSWRKLYQKIADYAEQETEKSVITIKGIEKGEDDVVSDQQSIITMLMQAADDGTQMEIAFGNHILKYKAKIELEQDDDINISELSSEYLRQGLYLRLSIEDADAIKKAGAGFAAVLQFTQNNRLNEFYTQLLLGEDEYSGSQQRKDDPFQNSLFRMTFPDTIFRKMQRRSHARFSMPPDAKVSLMVERPAQITFPAQLRNIGNGGLSFLQPADITPMTENCHLKVVLQWDIDQEIILNGTLVKNKITRNEICAHIRFSIESYEVSRALGELVSDVERIALQKRSKKRSMVGYWDLQGKKA